MLAEMGNEKIKSSKYIEEKEKIIETRNKTKNPQKRKKTFS
jgi:hypothetical protein